MPNLRKDRLYGWEMNFKRAFIHLLALFWLWQAQLSNDVFRARCSVAFKKCQRTIAKNVALDFINTPIALENHYWATVGNILCFLAEESKVLLFLISCGYNLVFDRWKERVARKLVPSFVPKVQKMWKTTCHREPCRGWSLYSFLYTIW